MTLAYTISREHLVHVLQRIALKQQTGRLSIEHIGEHGSEKGEIFFANGNTIFARTEHELGEAALNHMMNWRVIQYAFFKGVQIPDGVGSRGRVFQLPRHLRPPFPIELEQTHQIDIPAIPIELEETRETPSFGVPVVPKGLKRTAAQVSTTLPISHPVAALPQVAECVEQMGQEGVYAVFRVLPHVARHNIIAGMERRDRVVLLLLDGKRTVRDIARLVHRSELDIAGVLVRLMKQGYIEHV